MIQLTNLNLAFDHPIFVDASFTFEDSKNYVITGESGVGKTTLLNILAGFIVPDSVSICGLSKKKISYVFQDNRLLLPYDALTNIRLAIPTAQFKEQEALITSTLASVIPAEELHKPLREYSGGMKKRVAILRALFFNSDIVLMDEPFASLDLEMKHKMVQLIKEKKNNRTLIISSHAKEDIDLFSATEIHLT